MLINKTLETDYSPPELLVPVQPTSEISKILCKYPDKVDPKNLRMPKSVFERAWEISGPGPARFQARLHNLFCNFPNLKF